MSSYQGEKFNVGTKVEVDWEWALNRGVDDSESFVVVEADNYNGEYVIQVSNGNRYSICGYQMSWLEEEG